VELALRRLGPTGLLVTELGLGTLTFGREADEQTAGQLLGCYLDSGGNLLDTADVYGESEVLLGRLLRGRRDDVLIATKVGLPPYQAGEPGNEQGASRHHIRTQVERSLRRLGTDRIDLYQVHCWDPMTPLPETLSTLNDLVRAGKIRYIGVSNFTGWQVATALGVARQAGLEPLVSLSPQYSLVERGFDGDLAGVSRAEQLGVLPYSPLGGGFLTGKYRPDAPPPDGSRGARTSASTASLHRRLRSERNHEIAAAVREMASSAGRTPAQVALNWVLHRPLVTAPIIGARSVAQLRDNLGAAGWRLADDDRRRLDDVSAVELGYPHDWLEHYGLRAGHRPDREITGIA
jgi:aryl-alcohol dehydrogenase-like predicted oxidoreductase